MEGSMEITITLYNNPNHYESIFEFKNANNRHEQFHDKQQTLFILMQKRYIAVGMVKETLVKVVRMKR